MKKIIVLFVLLLGSIISIAQPVTQRGTTSVTVQDARLFAEFNFRPPAFPDTIRANQQIGLDSCGALIYSRDINAYYYRACSPKRWVRVASGGATADSAYLSYRPLTDSTFLLCRVGGTRCDTIKVNGKGVSTAWIVGGNTNPSPPNLGTVSTTDVNIITNNVARMKVAGNGINRSAAARNKYLMIDTLTRYLFYGDADTAYTSSHKINDTTFSLCRTNGKCDTITIGNTVINNFTNTSQTRLISGSAVWDSLMIYSVTNCWYYINGVLYNSTATNVTLDPADSSNPRIDVIYCDTLGNVGVITGIPSPDPVKPVVNPLSQIELTHIYINAQATTPAGVSARIIYNENTGIPSEWNTSSDPLAAGVNYNYSTNPYVGVKSAFAPQYVGLYTMSFTNDALVNADTISNLNMYLRLNSPVPTNFIRDIFGNVTEAPLFTVSLLKSGTQVTSELDVINQNYGYDRLVELTYQNLSIPLSNFVFRNSLDKTFDQILFTVYPVAMPKLGAQFDYIKFTSGGTPPPKTSEYWSLSGNDNSSFPNAKLGTTSKDQLSIVTNDIERINITNGGVISIPQLQSNTDTSLYKPLAINPTTGEVTGITNWGNNIVYTQNPIMSMTSGDSNIIYFNPDTANAWRGGGGTTPTLQDVLTAGNTSENNKDITLWDSPGLNNIITISPTTGFLYDNETIGGNVAILNGDRLKFQRNMAGGGAQPLASVELSHTGLEYYFNDPANTFTYTGNLKYPNYIPDGSVTSANFYLPLSNGVQAEDTLATLQDVRNSGGGGGSGTVTSIATGYGLSGGTITTNGTLTADTSVSGLSGKYLRITDGWKLKGNSGTTSSTDFLGTTDDQDLVLKRNNTIVSTFRKNGNHSIGGQVGVGSITAVGNITFGASDMSTITSGSYNMQLNNSNSTLTTGWDNIFMGNLSGYNTTSGYGNIYIGKSAGVNLTLLGNRIGNYNLAIGYNAGLAYSGLTTGSRNTFLGAFSGRNFTTTSSSNIVLGDSSEIEAPVSPASTLSIGNRNIIIGSNINLTNRLLSNQLNIGNLIFGIDLNGQYKTISSGKIGIGVITPTDKFHVNGTTKITDTLKLTGLQSKTDTTTNKPLAIDASGNIVKMNNWVSNGGGSTGRFGNDTATVVMAKVHNNSGVTLTNGKIVALSSSGTSSEEPAVRLANNKHDSTSANTLGFVSGNIAVNDTGWVILSGKIEKLNTSAFANGDIIYLDSISGEWTKTKPVAPYHLVYLGVVIKANAGNGAIFVKPQNGYELNEIHDVKLTSPINNDVLAYSDTQSLWKNRNIYSIVDTTTKVATKYDLTTKQTIDTTTYYLISDFNTTSTTGANSNLTFNLGANEVRRIMIAGTCSKATSSTGLKVGIAAPTGATLKASVYGQLNTINATANSILSAINTLSGTMNTAIGTEMPFRIEGVITNGSTAGAVTLQLATVTSNTATIYAGTVMSVTKVKGL